MVRGSRSDLAAVALAALSVAAGLGFDRVFATGRWLAPVVGAAIVPHLLGALVRRRRWSALIAGAISLTGLVLYVVWTVEPGTTTFGLPGAETLDALRTDLREGWELLRNSRAPAPVTNGALLLAVIAVWAMAQAADSLAFQRDASIGAVMPALVLFVVTAALGTDAGRLRWTLAFAVAAVIFLLLQHQALLERGRARFAGPRVGPGTGFVVAGIAAGLTAVLGGMVVAPALPGAGDEAVLDYRGLVDDDPDTYRTVTPIAEVGSKFLRQDRQQLFTVRSPVREYWRTAGLDEFDGEAWTLSSGDGEVSEGLDESTEGEDVSQEFEIGQLGDRWMPAAYRPTAVDGADVLVVPRTSTLVIASDSVTGAEYTVVSEVPPTVLTPAQLDAAEAPVPPGVAPYTELPSDFPDEIRAEAESIVAEFDNPYDRAVALDQYFESFIYDLDVNYEHSNEAMQEFLTEQRGFCEQFASTYAAMARAVDLPARVAVGFTPGTYDAETGTYEVTTHDAHAWPEVYLSGVGWTRFEPTPPSDQAGGADGDAPPASAEEPPATDPQVPATTAPPATAPPPDAPGTEIEIDPPALEAPDGDDSVHVGWWAAIAFGITLAAAAIVYAAFVIGAKTRRRARRRGDPDPARAVGGAWADTLDRLREAGLAPSPAATPLEAAQTAGSRAPVDAREPLRSLAAAYTETQYGPRAPEADDAHEAWAGADVVRAALGRGAGLVRRLRRQLDPTALRRS
jgi:transglutaminase-like putative cysteine protease